MRDIGNSYLQEESQEDGFLLEDGSGLLLVEEAPSDIGINNYQFVTAENGISVTEKIR